LARRDILLSRTALRQLDCPAAATAKRIRERIRILAEDPYRARPGADIRPLWAHEEPLLDRLRAGTYRVPYFVLPAEVRVTGILHRSQAYRGIDWNGTRPHRGSFEGVPCARPTPRTDHARRKGQP